MWRCLAGLYWWDNERHFQNSTFFKKETRRYLALFFLRLTIYNTVILVRSVIKFLDRNFHFIEKVKSFLDSILFRRGTKYNLKRREPSRYRKIKVQKLFSTVNQNNIAIGSFLKRLCTCLISMAISIDQISFKTKQK